MAMSCSGAVNYMFVPLDLFSFSSFLLNLPYQPVLRLGIASSPCFIQLRANSKEVTASQIIVSRGLVSRYVLHPLTRNKAQPRPGSVDAQQ